jgi:hypothetical protein
MATANTALNRLRYDTCAYSKALSESIAPIDYVINPIKYEHCSKCRIELGVVGGSAVSHINGNLVDLENELFNITRPTTRCPGYQYHPTPAGQPIRTDIQVHPGRKPNRPIDTQHMHLKPCQMVSYPEVPQAQWAKPFTCPNN